MRLLFWGFFFMWPFIFTEKSTSTIEPLLTFILYFCKCILQTGDGSLYKAIISAVHYIMWNQTYIYISFFFFFVLSSIKANRMVICMPCCAKQICFAKRSFISVFKRVDSVSDHEIKGPLTPRMITIMIAIALTIWYRSVCNKHITVLSSVALNAQAL